MYSITKYFYFFENQAMQKLKKGSQFFIWDHFCKMYSITKYFYFFENQAMQKKKKVSQIFIWDHFCNFKKPIFFARNRNSRPLNWKFHNLHTN